MKIKDDHVEDEDLDAVVGGISWGDIGDGFEAVVSFVEKYAPAAMNNMNSMNTYTPDGESDEYHPKS